MSILQRYLARLLISRWLLIVFILVALVLMLDLMANGDDVVASEGARLKSLLRYMALRLPIVFARLFPYTLLLAALITLVGLTLRRELVAIMAAGISQARLMAAVAPVAVLLAAMGFIVTDQLSTRATEELRAWGVGDYARDGDSSAVRPLWLHEGTHVIRIGFAGQRGILEDIAVFEHDVSGSLTAKLNAPRAVHESGTWWLQDVIRLDVATMDETRASRIPLAVRLAPEQIAWLATNPRELTFAALKEISRQSGLGAYPAYVYDLRLQRKFAEPVVIVVIFLLTIPLVQRFQRESGGAAIVGIGLLGGFIFFVVDAFLVGMGEAGLLPPMVAAWAATVICALIGMTLAAHQEVR